MNIHLIIDFQYNYYRNKSSFEARERAGYAKRLSSLLDGEEVDTTYMYLTLKDIESYRKKYMVNKDGTVNNVTVSIAVDSKTDRKKQDVEYKANRASNRLDGSDFESIDRTVNVLKNVGYNVYKLDGCEADDIIHWLCTYYKDSYDLTIIHTNDSDILVNLDRNVGVARFKSNLKKHVLVTPDNFSELMGSEFKCLMPYNCIMLYKCLVGDKSDNIKGVKGFGVKAFDKAVAALQERQAVENKDRMGENKDRMGENKDRMGENKDFFEGLNTYENVKDALIELRKLDIIKDEQVNEALSCLDLVKYKNLEKEVLACPVKNDSFEKREAAYMKYNMKSLIG